MASSTIMDPARTQTVRFNVGGKHFETARTLIEQYSDTVLARLISERWDGDDPGRDVFIDRDGDLFSLVLNYMRYGSITLPATLPLDMFTRELDFYGIHPAEGSISLDCHLHARVSENHAKIVASEKRLRRRQVCEGIRSLAHVCANKYVRESCDLGGRSLPVIVLIDDEHSLIDAALLCRSEYKEEFQNYLLELDLCLEKIKTGGGGRSLVIAVKGIPVHSLRRRPSSFF
ncbi:hypothetical protein ACHAWF_009243 [Thalassiosira exigua]